MTNCLTSWVHKSSEDVKTITLGHQYVEWASKAISSFLIILPKDYCYVLLVTIVSIYGLNLHLNILTLYCSSSSSSSSWSLLNLFFKSTSLSHLFMILLCLLDSSDQVLDLVSLIVLSMSKGTSLSPSPLDWKSSPTFQWLLLLRKCRLSFAKLFLFYNSLHVWLVVEIGLCEVI